MRDKSEYEKARDKYEAEPAVGEKYICEDGTEIYCTRGTKSGDDLIIKTRFPNRVQSHKLEYIGQCLRMKGEIEETNYPSGAGYRGKQYLSDFAIECIWRTDIPVLELCRKFKIPTGGKGGQNERSS